MELALGYGFLLGLGALTAVVVSAFWVFVALSVAAPPGLVVVAWAGYASARALGFVIAVRSGETERAALSRSALFVVKCAALGLSAATVAAAWAAG